MIYFKIVTRTILFYVIIMITYRVMGKREVGELSVVDLMVSLLMAELAAMSIENLDDSIWLSLAAIATVVGLQILFAKVSFINNFSRRFLEGKPSVIISKGIVNFKEMIKQRYNLNDLLSQLRGQGVKSIENVDYAILENNGLLSVFQKEKRSVVPMPIIVSGALQFETIHEIGKDATWVYQLLKKHHLDLKDVFYAPLKALFLCLFRHGETSLLIPEYSLHLLNFV